MPSEKFANNASDTLNGGITAGATSLVVNSATLFPTSGQFRILIDNEIILVGAVSGTTFSSLTRGAESTAAASHSNGVTVTQIYTTGAMDQRLIDESQKGTNASLPAAEKQGRLYLASDGPYVYRDTGAAWEGNGPTYPMTPIVPGNFSWINQGGATLVTTGGIAFLTAPGSASDNLRIQAMTKPATPYKITAKLSGWMYPSNFAAFGLVWISSSTGKLHTFALAYDGGVTPAGLTIQDTKWNSTTSFNSHYSNGPGLSSAPSKFTWLRIAEDASHRTMYFSADGFNWIQYDQVAAADFITADQVGFYANSVNSNPVYLSIESWIQG